MLKTVWNNETKQATMTADVPTMRLMGIAFATGIGGIALAQEIIQGLVAAADNTSNDEDYQNQADELFQHIRDEHTTSEQAKELVNIMQGMAMALPRTIIMTEHFRQLGQSASASESFNA